MVTGKPVLTGAGDYGKGVKVVTPSFYGAHNWQPMSYSPKTGLAYIPM
jgi:quinohemoprotein ethanol dehydrogenase